MSTNNENNLNYKVFSLSKGGRRTASPTSLSELLVGSLFVGKSFYPRFVSHLNNSLYSIWRIEELAKRDLTANAYEKENIDKQIANKLFASFRQRLTKALKVDKNKTTEKELYEICSSVFGFLSKAKEQTESCRIILAPSNELKSIQSKIQRDLSYINVHSSAFGFAINRSAFDCANFHILGHDKKIELLVNLDIKNFFGSVLSRDLTSALMAHGFDKDYTNHILHNSTVLFTQQNAIKLMVDACFSLLNWGYVQHFFSGTMVSQLPLYMRGHPVISSSTIFKTFLSKYVGWIIGIAIKNKWIDKESVFDAFKDLLNLGSQIKLGSRFLPQGSPTSPTLSNLAVKRMDYRLAGFAQKHGAIYSRYADDMSFTWTERMGKKRINIFISSVQGIIKNHGFELNNKKTRIMGTGSRMDIVGYIINSGRPTVSSKYIEAVRAEILGMNSVSSKHKNLLSFQSKLESIRGKISFIQSACPEKAQKLLAIFSKLSPPSGSETRRIEVSLDHE